MQARCRLVFLVLNIRLRYMSFILEKNTISLGENLVTFFFYACFNVTSLLTCVGLSLEMFSDKQYFKFPSSIIYNLPEAGDLKFVLKMHRQQSCVVQGGPVRQHL